MKITPDMLAVPGIGLCAYGLWLVHPAAMFLGVGSLLVFLGVIRSKRKDS